MKQDLLVDNKNDNCFLFLKLNTVFDTLIFQNKQNNTFYNNYSIP